MANEHEVETEVEVKETITPELDGDGKTIEAPESKKEVPEETPEAKEARLKRQLEQHRKKFGLKDEEKPKPKPKGKESDEFNEGQLAYLLAKGIESDEDVEFVQGELSKHGGNLRELFGNDYFKSTLQKRKDAASVLDATPKNEGRTGSPSPNSVEYHYAKYMQTGKLPSDSAMREKVVDFRLKKETTGNQFTSQPVIGM